MLPFREHGPADAPLTFLLLHFFGGSHREWDSVVSLLAPTYRTIAADLPGFGEARALEGLGVQQLVDRFRTLLEYLAPAPVILVGHSMAGKAAMVLSGDPPANLRGTVLIAPSPLSGEPMSEEQRATMCIANATRARAEAFTRPGFAHPPTPEIFEIAVEDVLRGSDESFHDWPENGTREDWSERVPELRVKTLLVVGTEDKAITPAQQLAETLPLVERTGGRLHLLPATAHLVPYEQPRQLADILTTFAREMA